MIQPRRPQTTEIKAGYTASRRPPCTRNYVTGQEGGRDEGTTASSLSLSTFLREKGETLPFPYNWCTLSVNKLYNNRIVKK